MLIGVFGAEARVRFCGRAGRRSTGQSEGELVELLVREVEAARRARPGVAAVGLGIPATIDHERGIAVSAVNLPIDDCRYANWSPRGPGCRSSSTTMQTSRRLAEHLNGAGAGRRQRGDADDRHRDRRRPDPRRQGLPGRDGSRRRARPRRDRDGRPALPGKLPWQGLRRDLRIGDGPGPGSASRRRARAGLRSRRDGRGWTRDRRPGRDRGGAGRRRDGDRRLRDGRVAARVSR